jgi:hypothetical protein
MPLSGFSLSPTLCLYFPLLTLHPSTANTCYAPDKSGTVVGVSGKEKDCPLSLGSSSAKNSVQGLQVEGCHMGRMKLVFWVLKEPW